MTDLVHFTKIIFQTLFLAQFIEKQYFCTGFQNAPDEGLFEPLDGGFSSTLLCAYKNGD